MNEHKGFLEMLQGLPEPTKKKILIVATSVIMVIVIYFWLAYFNSLIAAVPHETPIAEQDAGAAGVANAAAPAPTVFARFQNGMAFIGGAFLKLMHEISATLQAPRQYIVNPSP